MQPLASACYLVADHSYTLTQGTVPSLPSVHRLCRSSALLRAGMTCLTRGKLPTAFVTQACVDTNMQEVILRGGTN